MKRKQNSTWLMKAAVLPLLAAGLAAGCSDDEDPPAVDAAPLPDAAPVEAGPGAEAGTPTEVGAEASGAETGGCPEAVAVNTDIAQSTVWSCPKYVLGKKIFVINNSTLTIMPGVQVLGDALAAEKAALITTRGAKLIANGTAAAPIVFSSNRPVGTRVSGDWAGVALIGDAKINGGSPCTTAVAGCREGNLEGLPVTEPRGFYGGVNDTGSCGEISYARIEFAGAIFTEGKELNGLTLAGCGSATKVSHVQIHRGKDDGIEFFGGTANVDHILITGSEDDNLDWDFGWSGIAQFVIVHQYVHPDANNGFEGSSNTANEAVEPRSNPKISNVTLISDGGPKSTGMTLNQGTRGKITNSIVYGFKFDVVDFVATTNNLTAEVPANLSIDNTFFFNNGAYLATDTTPPEAMFNDQMAVENPARNNKTNVDPMFGSLTPATPNYVPANAALDNQPAPPFGVTTATFAGALKPGDAAPWYLPWAAFPIN